ncbi:glucosyltransferase [Salipiger aestuarii]|uniref:Glucans biosynthesis glucosyltransferase H n=1 Tax=Salipiger aestuarii TaxID=568098 RepID=A0A327YY83_9RHOB|nr:glucans biosynthesis glucosyltransferase MdoH [Salipiger aestuarii]EIE49214.1 glucosyltransferase MdoH [Citreicella sp. 357]KAA8609737.1 glucosyltransferase [Salipiger aestuarii]KAB2543637.1 glucosyltransferase [Salipiger aestuarii]RAK22869.1 membrane glycosyltransferase [Salipiger aestuarii]
MGARVDLATAAARAIALALTVLAAVVATWLTLEASIQDGVQVWDVARAVLILVTTGWLAWGAVLGINGLVGRQATAPAPQITGTQPRTVVLVPICNEDPVATFARVAAMDRSVSAAGVATDIAILSDTRDETLAAVERVTFARLLRETGGEGRIFYRRRTDNRGRKAGNIEDFFRSNGGAYEFAVILDADSLMEGSAIREMIARMQADPRLGLLQTLPKVVGAHSFFGRAMQFASVFHGPVFTRGLARLQGRTGPFWGHNAIVRVHAFVQSCGLPELGGKPPFGGHILSHDYVEAALLARAGWTVKVEQDIDGSFEEGPENLLSYARRDRRWCQGNLQHIRLLTAPGFALWSRYVFVQGIFSYLVSLLWAAFLVATVAGTVLAPEPDYFPDMHQLYPVFPSDRSREITALFFGIVGLLILPKVAILWQASATGRARGFGGTPGALRSVLTEILLTSAIAPVMLMFQSRAVLQVLSGQDGGWPANARGEGRLGVREGVAASWWIVITGGIILASVYFLAPGLTLWLLPVALPMIAAPWLIAFSSRSGGRSMFIVPEEFHPPAVVRTYRDIHSRWTIPGNTETPEPEPAMQPAS